MIKPEEIWSISTEEKELGGNFARLQKFATCKFRRLPIFATYKHCSPVCPLKIPKGIVEDVLVKVDKFYYPVDFVVLDTKPMANSTH